MLSAIAGSLITVTSLTFSLTVVTLQLASSQFSPRLLRTFSRDRFVHATLALFLATFSYALTVLRTVRGTDATGRQQEFVPQISVTTAFVLTLASVAGLVLFLAHLAREIRVETMMRRVRAEATDTVRAVLPVLDPGASAAPAPEPLAGSVPVPARSSGFLVAVDEKELLAAAVEAGAVLRVDRTTGDFLVAGTPVGTAWSLGAGTVDDGARSRLLERAAAALETGTERTQLQDVALGFRQLTDVAVKALSPGINDPTTAAHTLGHLSALLCELAGRDLGPHLIRDDRDEVRVVLTRPGFADLLELAIGQPRRFGAADPTVLGRIADLLAEVAWCARRPDQRAAVADQLDRLRVTAGAQDLDAADRRRLDDAAGRVTAALTGRWVPG